MKRNNFHFWLKVSENERYNKEQGKGGTPMTMDCNERIFYYFNELTKIPHGSRNEKQLSDWLVQFAKDHGLRWIQDEMNNVMIYKDGTAGMEQHGAVILQAHMDMVCEKEADVDFDFETQPLDTYVEDGWLKARGTTLGADDGVGVAMMLALLEDDQKPHPPLECVFTVMEEIGLNGAQGLKKEYFTAHRMINMDCGGEDKTAVSTAGGLVCTMTRVRPQEKWDGSGWKLTVSGLKGGHSGGNIDKELGNANKIAIRALRELVKNELEVWIADWDGGNKDNAIPRDCWIRFASQDSRKVRKAIEKVAADVKAELKASDPEVTLTLSEDTTIENVYSAEDSKAFIDFITVLPNGLRAKSMAIPGLTWASENLASIKRRGSSLVITLSLRSAQKSWIEKMSDELEILSGLYGWTCSFDNGYPAWDYKEESVMRQKLAELVKEKTGKQLKLEAGHGGTECGVFCEMIPDIDIVTMVPEASGAHTPQEKLNLATFQRTYALLCELLSRLDA